MKTKIMLRVGEKTNPPLVVALSSVFFEGGVKFPNTDNTDKTVHNHFKVKVEVDGKHRTFDYYGSQADYEDGKDDLTEQELKFAFRSIMDDGNVATSDFEDFCFGFGYDTDSRRAERIYKACVKTKGKLEELGLDDFVEIIDKLSEMGVE